MGFEKIACCYHSLTAYLIQYLLLAAAILGVIFNIIGFILILWGYISRFIEFLYVMCFIFNIFSIACILLLIYYRQKKLINNEKNKLSIRISFINIIIVIVGLLFGIICLIYCSVKYYDHETEIQNGQVVKVIDGWDKFFMFLIMGLNLRFFLFLFFFWVSILIRLLKKTSGAYVENKKIEMNISTVSNISNDGGENKNNNNIIQTQSGSKNITKEVKVIYGIRELNLK